ncbi:MAG TPA: hypothetical protein VHY08_29375 [Bacillota bacterium]|nr:hypothetical protein [Bacillota bacterium]
MSQPNQISLTIPEQDLNEIKACIEKLNAKLLPLLKTLSPADRHELPKMGDKTIAFVQKALLHCQQNPDMVPQFMDVNEFAIDVKAIEILRAIYQPLLQLVDSISDTMILSGSEAYSASLMFYSSTKAAMKLRVQKAETIYSDLSARFPGKPRQVESDPAV